jgi:hypothetical protein
MYEYADRFAVFADLRSCYVTDRRGALLRRVHQGGHHVLFALGNVFWLVEADQAGRVHRVVIDRIRSVETWIPLLIRRDGLLYEGSPQGRSYPLSLQHRDLIERHTQPRDGQFGAMRGPIPAPRFGR